MRHAAGVSLAGARAGQVPGSWCRESRDSSCGTRPGSTWPFAVLSIMLSLALSSSPASSGRPIEFVTAIA